MAQQHYGDGTAVIGKRWDTQVSKTTTQYRRPELEGFARRPQPGREPGLAYGAAAGAGAGAAGLGGLLASGGRSERRGIQRTRAAAAAGYARTEREAAAAVQRASGLAQQRRAFLSTHAQRLRDNRVLGPTRGPKGGERPKRNAADAKVRLEARQTYRPLAEQHREATRAMTTARARRSAAQRLETEIGERTAPRLQAAARNIRRGNRLAIAGGATSLASLAGYERSRSRRPQRG